MENIYTGSLAGYSEDLSKISLKETTLKCESCNGNVHELLIVPKNQIGLSGNGSYKIVRCLNCIFWGPYFVHFSGDIPTKVVLPEEYECHNFVQDQCEADSIASIKWQKDIPNKENHWTPTYAGGKPLWEQTPEWPVCPSCNREMNFILQLSSASIDQQLRPIQLDTEFLISIEYYSTLYFFSCDECAVTCSITQST